MIGQHNGLRSWVLYGVLGLVVLSVWPAVASAQLPAVVRVEEDWELVVGQPDVDSNAPQVTCAMSPFGHLEWLHCTFDMNYQSLLEYAAGGLQLEVWANEVPLIERRAPCDAVLSHPGETIRWTASMQASGGMLTFEIINGHSTTWGEFGGQGYLKASINAGVSDLNHYDPAVSAESSGIGYAANRVVSLTLKRVRRFLSNGEILEDDTPRVVHPDE